MIEPPTLPKRSRRAEEIIAVARELTEEIGWESLTMRILADRVGIKAPSLYKHTANKDELRALLTIDSLLNVGYAMWATEHEDGSYRLRDLVMTFRQAAVSHPELYRLVMTGSISCEALQKGQWRQLLVETSQWLNVPLSSIAPNRMIAYAVWSSAYGLATLETNRSLDDSDGEATKVWNTLIDVYEPHFEAARKARENDTSLHAEIDTLHYPLEIIPHPMEDTVGEISPLDGLDFDTPVPFPMPVF
ncbi:TetR/AcrR family transcriptional regulator [Corynebacterium mendelii]|nr:TetR family transcriptional regulator [Corynebacterium mendelii]